MNQSDQIINNWANNLNKQTQNAFENGDVLLPNEIWENSVEQIQQVAGSRRKRRTSKKRRVSRKRRSSRKR